MGRSFHGNPGSGSPSTGDRIVADGASLVVEGERQWRETDGAQTRDHIRATIRGHAEEEESAPAGSGDLAAVGAAIPGDLVPAIDLGRAHALRQTALELPALIEQRTELWQIPSQDRLRHGGGQLFDAMQA